MLCRIFLFFLVVGVFSLSRKFSLRFSFQERKALFKEMVEMDISIRSISSLLSLGDQENIGNYFSRLSQFQMIEDSWYGKYFRSSLRKIQMKGLFPYWRRIQKISKETEEYIVDSLREGKNLDWGRIEKSYQKIIQNCRACHERVQFPKSIWR